MAQAPGAGDDPAAEITKVEERLLAMSPMFQEWSEQLSEGGLAGFAARTFPSAALYEPASLPDADEQHELENWGCTMQSWRFAEKKPIAYQPGDNEPLDWLKALLPKTGEVTIKTLDGEMVAFQDTFVFRTHHKFSIRSAPGARRAHATVEGKIDWGQLGDALKVIRWELVSARFVQTSGAPPLLGEDVLDSLVPDSETLAALRRCRHEDFMRASFSRPTKLKAEGLPGFDLSRFEDLVYESNEQHPALSAADVNGDGRDDLYVMQRWGPNQLLVAAGDGTFVDRAADYGVDLDSHCTCALFLDFDNDGDQDLFVGRSLERSVLFENTGGEFVDISDRLSGAEWPYLVTSAAAADYDGDGLLDLYIGTYFGRKEGWQQRFMTYQDAREYRRRKFGANKTYDAAGPPNLLLKNGGGGRFGVAPENGQVQLWRATFQPTFADFDADGDPDLLVNNDFGTDVLLRNDPGEGGRRTFTDVTSELAGPIAANYFGMGGSWADYDEDGRLDLYLSAMYSKAGTRITGRLPEFDLRARQSAEGNLLFAGRGGSGLAKTSGKSAGQHPVHQVGWAWGGQFFDPDNDGDLDLYAPTGFFSPPPDLSLEVDF